MYINQDYKNWYLFQLAKQSIETLKKTPDLKILLVSETNDYILEYLRKTNISCTVSSELKNIKDYSDILLLKPGFEYITKINDNQIKNLYSEFHNYEVRKTPIDYLVDEFKQDTEAYNRSILKKEIIAKEYIVNYNNRCMRGNFLKLFNKIEIETINRCNNICSFCPISQNQNKRQLQCMSEDLFKNIIQQLEKLNYNGALALFSNNEPLLDERLPKLAKIARRHLPNAYIYIYTNGILLTPSILSSLLESIDYIRINNYNTKPLLNSSVQAIHTYLKETGVQNSKVSIHLRNLNEVLSTRGGSAPNKTVGLSLTCGCILPFSQLVIRPDGKVSLCCNDALGRITIGDSVEQHIIDIWHNKARAILCNELHYTRKKHPICQNCDFIFSPLYSEKI